MKQFLRALTRRQKVILAVTFIANVTALTLAIVLLRSTTAAAPTLPVAGPGEICSDLAASLLTRKNMAGWASVGPDNILRLHLSGLDSSGQPLPQPSDAAWDALAAMLSMPRAGCGPYPFVLVDVPIRLAYEDEITSTTRLLVSADWVDLRAWGYGELDDNALAQRLQTTLYAQPSK